MTRQEATLEMEKKFELYQTPPDWLNEFETRNEAYSAWIAAKVAGLRRCGRCGEIVGIGWEECEECRNREIESEC